MLKKAIVFWVTFLVMSTFACEQEKSAVSSPDTVKPGALFTISGEVTFPKDADIYLFLKTQNEEEKGERIPSSRIVVVKLTPGQKKGKRAPFKFVGVPKGSYCIRAFQDLNKNGKFDTSGQHAAAAEEPFGLYKNAFPQSWNLIRFEVNKNITGIKIELRFYNI
jgi:hypothetical protein